MLTILLLCDTQIYDTLLHNVHINSNIIWHSNIEGYVIMTVEILIIKYN